MIRVFGQTDRNFSSNGDVVLNPIKAKIHKADNGDYYLEIETGLQYLEHLVEGNIIVANTPQGDQPFRISNPQVTNKKITIKAWHVFYDSKNYLIANSKVQNKTCDQAIRQFNSATDTTSEFTVSSDILSQRSLNVVRDSLHNTIMNMIVVWGGHLVRNGFGIQIKSAIGDDYGITVRYKKNLREITVAENWDDVVTKILPVGKDDTLLNAVQASASIYIESATQYQIPYTKTVSFEQNIEREDYSSDTAYKTALVNDLRTQADGYLAVHCVPQVNYTIKAHMDRVTDIGDTIHVRDERLNLNLLTSVISYDYDCLLQKFTEIQFGNFKKTLSGLIPSITAGFNHTLNMTVSGINSDMYAMSEEIQMKQDILISGYNIKTINNETLLGSGDLSIPGGVSDVRVNGTSVVSGGIADVSVPTETSDLINDSNFVSDANYVHTDNNFTSADVSKLSGISDYVVEEGTDGIWRYRKWNSGISECWGKHTQTMSSGSSVLGGYAYTTSKISYPANLFTEEPVAHYSGRIGSGYCLCGTMYGASKDSVQIWAISQVSGSRDCVFLIRAIGKWK